MAAPMIRSVVEHWPKVFMLLVLSAVKSYESDITKNAKGGCDQVRTAYQAKGFNSKEVPYTAVSGEHLQMCPQGFTCCTQNMEKKLNDESKAEFNKAMSTKISLLRTTFISRTAKFDAFFSELLDNAKNDLHTMFVRTYGLLYQQNSHVFTDLFEELRTYYKGGNINLEDTLNDFFATLCQKMFALLNANYVFDSKYLQCVTAHMDALEPFGDVPKKLSIQVQRGFIAARTFVQGLAVGRDVVLEISKLKPTSSCGKAVMKMLFCPYCRGMPDIKPCSSYCLNVMRGCLSHQADLDDIWNKYIDALLKLAERLAGPFNIESVVDPIDVKISDAIMNFQENSESVSNKVFSGCGTPKLRRDKRSTAGDDFFDMGRKKGPTEPAPTTAAGTSLNRLVTDIREKVAIVKGFWNHLPHTVCNDLAAPMSQEDNCWNGLTQAKYQHQIMNDGTMNQANNPEVEVDVRGPNLLVNQQILRLKIITNKLKKAYAGIDVDYIDLEIGGDERGGSGSGSGYDQGSGSGMDVPIRGDLGFIPTQPPQKHRTPPSYNNNPRTYGGSDKGAASANHMSLLFILLTSVIAFSLQRS